MQERARKKLLSGSKYEKEMSCETVKGCDVSCAKLEEKKLKKESIQEKREKSLLDEMELE